MRKFTIIFVNVLLLLGFYGCSGNSETIVAKYGDYSVSLDEFKDAYDRNLFDKEEAATDTVTDKNDFLDLYVDYKMKLRDAQVRGFEDDQELNKEIDSYLKTVGTAYVQEKFVINPAIKKLYDERKTERYVRHILIRDKGRKDGEGKELAQSLLDSIKAGASFEELAGKYSNDEYSKPDGGDIYWLTAGQTIAPFNKALYDTKVGEVYPEVVKTRFGYHIIKVDSEQTRKYQVKARHILAAFQKNGKVDSAAALEKIETVEKKLKEGGDFAELAKEYSDDPGSSERGGDLGYFSRRSMVQQFDEAAFDLDKGEISEPIKTKYGYHIIQVEDIKSYPEFEKEKETLASLYQRNYFDYDKELYADTLKEAYNFTMNDSVLARLKTGAVDLDFTTGYWQSPMKEEIGDSTLYSFNNKSYTVNEVISDIDSTQKLGSAKMTAENVDKAVNAEIADKLFLQKAIDLQNGDTEFARLMEDYKKGLYIFKLQEEEVWNKLDNDSTKLYAYYEETKDNYVMPDRAEFSILFRRDSSSAAHDYNLLTTGSDFDSLVAKYSGDAYLKARSGKQKLTSVEDSKIAAKAFELSNAGDISEPFKINTGWYIVKLISKDPSRLKTFDEARSEVSSAWMEKESKRLEAEYLNKLKELYHPKMYYDKLSEIDSAQADQ